MSRIELKQINKYYGKNHVLKNINLVIEDGEFMTLLGPSGCGKTTTLRVIAGLEKPQEGFMYMGSREIVNATEKFYEEPGKRHLNLVFQSYALWPHMTVFNNVAFGLEVAKVPKDEIRRKVENALKRMRIEEFVDRYPSELSGGQQQRVAIARAIVSEPEVLLLDEPLSNLDAKLRVEMRSEIKRLHQELGTTIIYVTHDQTEALTMSTKIAIFFEGVLEQVAPPMELYQNPASIRVADFIGNPRVNFLPGTASLKDGVLEVESVLGTMQFKKEFLTEALTGSPMQSSGDHPVSSPADRPSFPVIVGVRPELIEIRSSKEPGTIEAQVYSVMPAGSETTVDLKAGSEKILSKQNGLKHYETDQNVWLKIDPGRINVFDKESGRLIKKAISDET